MNRISCMTLGTVAATLAVTATAGFPWDEIADDIALTSGGTFSSAEIAYAGFNFAGGETLTLNLYSMDGAPTPGSFGFATPGSLLYSQTLPITAANDGRVTFTDAAPSVVLPSTVAVGLVFDIDFPNSQAGPLLFDPPTGGSSFDDFWVRGFEGDADWALRVIDLPGGLFLPVNFGIELSTTDGLVYANLANPLLLADGSQAYLAVPEPGTWISMGGVGLLAASVLYRRFRQAKAG